FHGIERWCLVRIIKRALGGSLMKTKQVRHIVGAIIGVALLVSGCSGNNSDTDGDSSPPSQSDSSSSEDQNDSSESHELHALLRDLPMPEGHVIPFPASEYETGDPKKLSIAQHAQLKQSSVDAATFFLTELPKAGFTLVERHGGTTSVDDVVPDIGM